MSNFVRLESASLRVREYAVEVVAHLLPQSRINVGINVDDLLTHGVYDPSIDSIVITYGGVANTFKVDRPWSQGDRVKTPGGPGVVMSRRLKAPDYNRVASYSVCLDSRKHEPRYGGSTYGPDQVMPE